MAINFNTGTLSLSSLRSPMQAQPQKATLSSLLSGAGGSSAGGSWPARPASTPLSSSSALLNSLRSAPPAPERLITTAGGPPLRLNVTAPRPTTAPLAAPASAPAFAPAAAPADLLARLQSTVLQAPVRQQPVSVDTGSILSSRNTDPFKGPVIVAADFRTGPGTTILTNPPSIRAPTVTYPRNPFAAPVITPAPAPNYFIPEPPRPSSSNRNVERIYRETVDEYFPADVNVMMRQAAEAQRQQEARERAAAIKLEVRQNNTSEIQNTYRSSGTVLSNPNATPTQISNSYQQLNDMVAKERTNRARGLGSLDPSFLPQMEARLSTLRRRRDDTQTFQQVLSAVRTNPTPQTRSALNNFTYAANNDRSSTLTYAQREQLNIARIQAGARPSAAEANNTLAWANKNPDLVTPAQVQMVEAAKTDATFYERVNGGQSFGQTLQAADRLNAQDTLARPDLSASGIVFNRPSAGRTAARLDALRTLAPQAQAVLQNPGNATPQDLIQSARIVQSYQDETASVTARVSSNPVGLGGRLFEDGRQLVMQAAPIYRNLGTPIKDNPDFGDRIDRPGNTARIAIDDVEQQLQSGQMTQAQASQKLRATLARQRSELPAAVAQEIRGRNLAGGVGDVAGNSAGAVVTVTALGSGVGTLPAIGLGATGDELMDTASMQVAQERQQLEQALFGRVSDATRANVANRTSLTGLLLSGAPLSRQSMANATLNSGVNLAQNGVAAGAFNVGGLAANRASTALSGQPVWLQSAVSGGAAAGVNGGVLTAGNLAISAGVLGFDGRLDRSDLRLLGDQASRGLAVTLGSIPFGAASSGLIRPTTNAPLAITADILSETGGEIVGDGGFNLLQGKPFATRQSVAEAFAGNLGDGISLGMIDVGAPGLRLSPNLTESLSNFNANAASRDLAPLRFDFNSLFAAPATSTRTPSTTRDATASGSTNLSRGTASPSTTASPLSRLLAGIGGQRPASAGPAPSASTNTTPGTQSSTRAATPVSPVVVAPNGEVRPNYDYVFSDADLQRPPGVPDDAPYVVNVFYRHGKTNANAGRPMLDPMGREVVAATYMVNAQGEPLGMLPWYAGNKLGNWVQLNPEAREQAAALRPVIQEFAPRMDFVMNSPVQRAIDTMNLATQGVDLPAPTPLADFAERGVGGAFGMPKDADTTGVFGSAGYQPPSQLTSENFTGTIYPWGDTPDATGPESVPTFLSRTAQAGEQIAGFNIIGNRNGLFFGHQYSIAGVQEAQYRMTEGYGVYNPEPTRADGTRNPQHNPNLPVNPDGFMGPMAAGHEIPNGATLMRPGWVFRDPATGDARFVPAQKGFSDLRAPPPLEPNGPQSAAPVTPTPNRPTVATDNAEGSRDNLLTRIGDWATTRPQVVRNEIGLLAGAANQRVGQVRNAGDWVQQEMAVLQNVPPELKRDVLTALAKDGGNAVLQGGAAGLRGVTDAVAQFPPVQWVTSRPAAVRQEAGQLRQAGLDTIANLRNAPAQLRQELAVLQALPGDTRRNVLASLAQQGARAIPALPQAAAQLVKDFPVLSAALTYGALSQISSLPVTIPSSTITDLISGARQTDVAGPPYQNLRLEPVTTTTADGRSQTVRIEGSGPTLIDAGGNDRSPRSRDYVMREPDGSLITDMGRARQRASELLGQDPRLSSLTAEQGQARPVVAPRQAPGQPNLLLSPMPQPREISRNHWDVRLTNSSSDTTPTFSALGVPNVVVETAYKRTAANPASPLTVTVQPFDLFIPVTKLREGGSTETSERSAFARTVHPAGFYPGATDEGLRLQFLDDPASVPEFSSSRLGNVFSMDRGPFEQWYFNAPNAATPGAGASLNYRNVLGGRLENNVSLLNQSAQTNGRASSLQLAAPYTWTQPFQTKVSMQLKDPSATGMQLGSQHEVGFYVVNAGRSMNVAPRPAPDWRLINGTVTPVSELGSDPLQRLRQTDGIEFGRESLLPAYGDKTAGIYVNVPQARARNGVMTTDQLAQTLNDIGRRQPEYVELTYITPERLEQLNADQLQRSRDPLTGQQRTGLEAGSWVNTGLVTVEDYPGLYLPQDALPSAERAPTQR